MDTDIREIKRKIQLGDTILIPSYARMLLRKGEMPKIKPGIKEEFNARVLWLQERKWGNIWRTMNNPPINPAEFKSVVILVRNSWVIDKQMQNAQGSCPHTHKTDHNARNCLKKRIRDIILGQDDLMIKYVIV